MIHGDIDAFIEAMGADEQDPRAQRALAVVGDDFTRHSFRDRGVEEWYLSDDRLGASFLFEEGTLTAVFLRVRPTADEAMYFKLDSLIDGMSIGATRDAIESRFDTPLRATPTFVTYAVDGGFVQFEFDQQELAQIVVLLEIIELAAPAATDESEISQPSGTGPAGGIQAFLDAVGTSRNSSEHLTVLVLAGPAMDVYDEQSNGADWRYEDYPKNGVVLQFKNDLLVAALVRMVSTEDGESTYPDAGTLFADLELPATRESITTFLGSPVESTEDMDLYRIQDRYLRFDFVHNESTAVTVGLPGVSS